MKALLLLALLAGCEEAPPDPPWSHPAADPLYAHEPAWYEPPAGAFVTSSSERLAGLPHAAGRVVVQPGRHLSVAEANTLALEHDLEPVGFLPLPASELILFEDVLRIRPTERLIEELEHDIRLEWVVEEPALFGQDLGSRTSSSSVEAQVAWEQPSENDWSWWPDTPDAPTVSAGNWHLRALGAPHLWNLLGRGRLDEAATLLVLDTSFSPSPAFPDLAPLHEDAGGHGTRVLTLAVAQPPVAGPVGVSPGLPGRGLPASVAAGCVEGRTPALGCGVPALGLLHRLITLDTDAAVLAVPLGFKWAEQTGCFDAEPACVNPARRPAARALVARLGSVFGAVARDDLPGDPVVVVGGGDDGAAAAVSLPNNPWVCRSAGSCTHGGEARWASPLAFAGLSAAPDPGRESTRATPQILVVSALGEPVVSTDACRSVDPRSPLPAANRFAHTAVPAVCLTIPLPGEEAGSRVSGSSAAVGVASGLALFARAASGLPAPALRDLLVASMAPGPPELPAARLLAGIDARLGAPELRRALVDRDDGTPDGNDAARVFGEDCGEDARGSGEIGMDDLRRLRDAAVPTSLWAEHTPPSWLPLWEAPGGACLHDANGDGRFDPDGAALLPEALWSAFDFDGDAWLEADPEARTELLRLATLWPAQSEGVTAAELVAIDDDYLRAADLRVSLGGVPLPEGLSEADVAAVRLVASRPGYHRQWWAPRTTQCDRDDVPGDCAILSVPSGAGPYAVTAALIGPEARTVALAAARDVDVLPGQDVDLEPSPDTGTLELEVIVPEGWGSGLGGLVPLSGADLQGGSAYDVWATRWPSSGEALDPADVVVTAQGASVDQLYWDPGQGRLFLRLSVPADGTEGLLQLRPVPPDPEVEPTPDLWAPASARFTVSTRSNWDDDGDCFCEEAVGPSGSCQSTNGDCLSLAGGDCNDGDPTVYPGAPEDPDAAADVGEHPDGVDNDCDGVVDEGLPTFDRDGDGFCFGGELPDGSFGCTQIGVWPGDCRPLEVLDFPGAPERPDGIDNDCDEVEDEGTDAYDDDGDGYCEAPSILGVCTVGSSLDPDCDDGDADAYPGAPEVADGILQDCEGQIDEGTEVWDNDGDGFCAVGRNLNAEFGDQDCSDPGEGGLLIGDCDDQNPAIHPGAQEVQDGTDNDCDMLCDENADADGDGYTPTTALALGGPILRQSLDDPTDCPMDGLLEDCDEGAPEIHPGATELANCLDDDCDGSIDEADPFQDNDGDGYCPAPLCGCGAARDGTVGGLIGGDCDDKDGAVLPGGLELCDGNDNDCDGDKDEDPACLD